MNTFWKSTTVPDMEPVTLTDAKNWLRVVGDDEDSTLLGLIRSVRTAIEEQAGVITTSRTVSVTMDGFPSGSQIALPVSPVESLTSVNYYDEDGNDTELTGLVLIGNEFSPQLWNDDDWPQTYSRPDAVRIVLKAGYGMPEEVPANIIQAIKMTLAYWYDHRASVMTGVTAIEMPQSVKALISQFKRYNA